MVQQPQGKPEQTYFHSSAPNMGFKCTTTGGSKYGERVAFKNHFLITTDPAVIDYVRKNFVARKSAMFMVHEIDEATYQRAIAIKQPNPPAMPVRPAIPTGAVAHPAVAPVPTGAAPSTAATFGAPKA